MEQLSNCLELGIKKYSILSDLVAEQGLAAKKTSDFVEKFTNMMNQKSWTELGFYVFSGYLFGIISGILITIFISFCFKKITSKNKSIQDLKMVTKVPNVSTTNLSPIGIDTIPL